VVSMLLLPVLLCPRVPRPNGRARSPLRAGPQA
jgi:hypothetical protein